MNSAFPDLLQLGGAARLTVAGARRQSARRAKVDFTGLARIV
jgi:hypothetical protein